LGLRRVIDCMHQARHRLWASPTTGAGQAHTAKVSDGPNTILLLPSPLGGALYTQEEFFFLRLGGGDDCVAFSFPPLAFACAWKPRLEAASDPTAHLNLNSTRVVHLKII
jgi:hypothetical protein